MAILVTMTRLVVMVNVRKMAIMAVMEYYELASNVVFMGFF